MRKPKLKKFLVTSVEYVYYETEVMAEDEQTAKEIVQDSFSLSEPTGYTETRVMGVEEVDE